MFSRSSIVLKDLLEVIRTEKHRTIVLWAFKCIEKIKECLPSEIRNDARIYNAINLCKSWSRGEIKMPIAKKALLQVHQMAKETDDKYIIALLHAIGQGCAVVHVETHAIGIAIYELTSLVVKHGIDNCEDVIKDKVANYIELLKLCEEEVIDPNLKWADFLLKDDVINKELKLYEKKKY